jgi:hypothetical protein
LIPLSQSLLVNIYHYLFHSTLSYAIIFWGQATNTKKPFLIQTKEVHLIIGHGNRYSCINLFRQLGILPFKSQYIFSVLLFVLKTWNLLTTNYDVRNVQTRQSNNLYLPASALTLYQNGVYFTGIKLFNNLPLEIKNKRLEHPSNSRFP